MASNDSTNSRQPKLLETRSFNQADALDSYVALTDAKMWRAIEKIGLNIGLNDKPTRRHELAHKLLPHMGASITTMTTRNEPSANTVSDLGYGTGGKPVLYRV